MKALIDETGKRDYIFAPDCISIDKDLYAFYLGDENRSYVFSHRLFYPVEVMERIPEDEYEFLTDLVNIDEVTTEAVAEVADEQGLSIEEFKALHKDNATMVVCEYIFTSRN